METSGFGLLNKKNTNYILAVKVNQKQLLERIQDGFRFGKTNTSEDLDHARIETRTYSLITDFKFIGNKNDWEDLGGIIRVGSIREFKTAIKQQKRQYVIVPQSDLTRPYREQITLDASL